MNWAVVHVIHVSTPYRYIAKLFITDVPEEVNAKEIRTALTRAGYQFGEFNMPWANHYLSPEDEWEDEVVGAWKRGDVQTIDWAEIAPTDEMKRFTLRLPASLYDAVAEIAERQGVSMNTFMITALNAAVSKS